MNTTKSRNLREYFRHLWRSVTFWTIALALFPIFRYYALTTEAGIFIEQEFDSVYTSYKTLLNFGLVGFFIGILYATIEFYFDKFVSKRIALGFNILIQFVLISTAVIVISDLILTLVTITNDLNLKIDAGWWYKDPSFRPVVLYILCCSLVFSFGVVASEKFGQGVLLNMMLGKYKNPKEEKRIFMFLDLKSSTRIAEDLEHFKYSQLIQDCFYDLNEVAPRYRGEIYQYVGDEAVLSWPYDKGLDKANCLHLFFAFQKKIQSKASFYLNKYGIVPEFKAGLHGGKVMVAEVGVIKKELAYHGDVVNTTARIQGACNENNVSILISEDLLQDIQMKKSPFESSFIGEVRLKGKQNEVVIYGVSKNKSSDIQGA